MSIIAKYKFDKSIYADLLPEFNPEFTSDLYNTTDEEVDGIITRTIESDELPTLMRFGRLWVSGESTADNRTDSLLEVLEMNTSGLTSCSNMFRYNKNLTSIICEWDTSKVTNMRDMFSECYNLTSLDISNLDTNNATIMNHMFNSCYKLTSLDVSNFDTSNVTKMDYMFYNCKNLTSLDVSNFNTSNVTNMSYMFYNCTKLTSLDVSNFNTSEVTNMSNIFDCCLSLTEIHGISNWDTSNVTNMVATFGRCESLIELNLSGWDISSVTNADNLFGQCFSLVTLDISNFKFSTNCNINNIFNENLGNIPLADIGMLYCDQSTINKIASLLPTDTTQTIWVENVDVKDLNSVEGVEFKQYAKNTEIMLTSPLLEGDKLIVKDGKLYHYHKMGMVVLDGSEDWDSGFFSDGGVSNANTSILQIVNWTNGEGSNNNINAISDNFLGLPASYIWVNDVEGICDNAYSILQIRITKSKLSTTDVNGFKQWLSENPTTVVYKLASPYYELISEDPLDISLISETVDITNSSNIPLNMTINNKGLSTVAMSPSTTYTVAFDKEGEGDLTVNLCGNEVTTSNNIIEITTPSEIDDELIFYGDGVEVSNVRLLEGSVSGDSIPRESFEGLKNSFEDGYIGRSINSSLEFSILENTNVYSTFDDNTLYYSSKPDFNDTISPSSILQIKGLESSKVYTIAFKPDKDFQFTIAYGTGEWYYSETGTPCEVYANKFFISKFTCWDYKYAFVRLLQCDNSVRDITFSNMTILEGDWTHLTEEDWNNLGKYKVEYKVTGKNKFDKSRALEGYVPSINTNSNIEDIVLYPGTENYATSDVIKVIPGAVYTNNCKTQFIPYYYDLNGVFLLRDVSDVVNLTQFTVPDGAYYMRFRYRYDVDFTENLQIEEGSAVTEYEPYKSYTKTFYLNSPLLKGDTIEDINGVATHVKRYGKVVLDGSEDWKVITDGASPVNTNYIRFYIDISDLKMSDYAILNCDKFTIKPGINLNTAETCISSHSDVGRIDVCINKSGLSTPDVEGFKQWLQQNPVTAVYELASPIYEPVSTESILCDSYVNGHLDVDTNIPIEKVVFKSNEIPCRYSYPNTSYIVQFESDNVGHLDLLHWAGKSLNNIPVIKGINKVNISSHNGDTGSNGYFALRGIGFNASNIQIVATDKDIDFGYFKGLQSSFENNMENLWDGTFVEGVHITTNYTYSETINKTRSVCIKCRPNITYIITATNNDRLRIGHVSELVDGIPCMISDIDDTNISYKEFTTTHREGYLIVYVANEGNTNENITVDIREKANKVKCKVVGKNKFDFVQGNIDGYINKSLITIDYVNKTITGDNNSTNYRDFQLFVYLKANKSYVFSYKGFKINDNTMRLLEGKCDSYNSSKIIGSINNGILSTVTKDGWYTLHIHSLHGTISEIQIEEGTVATSYEPYQEYTKTIYLNSPLLKGDTIEVHNGKLCHYHKMGMVVLDGSEGWKLDFEKNNTITIYDSTFMHIAKSGTVVFCNKFPYVETSFSTYDSEAIKVGNIGLYININKSKLSSLDLNRFKQWLAENPTTVVYELASPYYEEIEPTQEDLIITSVKEGDLHIDTTVPISSKVTYNVNVQLLTDFEQSIVEQVQATQTTDLQSILDEEIDN